jgi:hypothetical protein
MDLSPETVAVAVTRVDGGVTLLRIVKTEYRAPDSNERAGIRNLGTTTEPMEPITARIVVATREVTPEVVNAAIQKYVDGGVWGGLKTDWKMPALNPDGGYKWRFVPDDYMDENTDRYFRNAFKDTPGKGKPDVDMPKAREVHKHAMRQARRMAFVALDSEYMMADEDGDQQKKRDIALKKKALRDVTADPAIEAAQTPEELKAVWPLFLGRNRVAERADKVREVERKQLSDLRKG